MVGVFHIAWLVPDAFVPDALGSGSRAYRALASPAACLFVNLGAERPRSQAEAPVGFVTITGIIRHVNRTPWATRLTVGAYRLELPNNLGGANPSTQHVPRLGDWLRATGTWQTNSYNLPYVRIARLEATLPRQDTWRGPCWQVINRLPASDALAALLLGAGRPDDRWAFQQAGLLHVLTVSGLHVGIVVMLIWWWSRFLAGPWWLAPSLTALGTLVFVGLSGGAPPVVRAGMMALSVIGAAMLGRRLSPFVPLALAAWVVWAMDPQCFSAARHTACRLLPCWALSRWGVNGSLGVSAWYRSLPGLLTAPCGVGC